MALPNKNVYGNLITDPRLLYTRELMNKVDSVVQEMAGLPSINL